MVSRLTFRDPTHDVAWQKQLRDKYNDAHIPDVDLSIGSAIVKPVSKIIAKQIIHKYEWLGTMAPTRYHFGIFFGNYCAGVTCIGGSSCVGGTEVHSPFGIKRNELLILARGANVHWSPIGANSKLVSWTCKLLSKGNYGKILIAYSDTDAGEIGTIYQACNWIYIGVGASTVQWVSPIGRIYDGKHPSNLRKRQGNKYPRNYYVDLLRDEGWKEQRSNPKHRYVAILDKRDKRLVELVNGMAQPYPKRDIMRVIEGNNSGVQPDNGGSTPTHSLLDKVENGNNNES